MPLVKAVFVPIEVKGAEDAKLKIGQVNHAADELKRSNPTIEVQVDKAKALLEARLLRAGIQSELSKGVEAKTGLFGGRNFGTGASGILGGIQSGLNSILTLGPGAIPVLAAIAAAAAGIATALGGAVAALGAAGIGFTAFGALAFPTLSKIVAGVGKVSGAATAVARDKAWDNIPKAMQPAVRGVLGLQTTVDGFASKIQPLVLQVVSGVLKAARDIIPAILPIAQVAGKAIAGLLKGFDAFAGSAGFRSFMAQMQNLAGPALTVIGKGIGSIVVSLGKLLQQMANPQGVATLAVLFKGVALAIGLVGLAFEGLNKTFLPFVSHTLSGAAAIVTAFKFVADAVLGSLQMIVDGTAKAFGWLPGGIGKSLRNTAAQFDQFRKSADSSLSDARSALNRWSQAVASAPKIFALKANITDLQNKLATARGLLADRNLTATRRARVEANIVQLEQQIAKAKAALDALNGKTVTTYVNTVALGLSGTTVHHMASGGVVGATLPNVLMVGEAGRELVALPSGSRVYPHGITERMMAAGGGGGNVYITISGFPETSNPAELGRQIAEKIKPYIKAGGRLYPAGIAPR